MKIGLIGYGKTGKKVASLGTELGFSIVAPFAPSLHNPLTVEKLKDVDVCIDFSHPAAFLENLKIVTLAKKPIVVGTTGWEKDLPKAKELVKEAGTGLIYSANFSFGVQIFNHLAKMATALLERKGFDPSILEIHHKNKVDSPSATALMLQKEIDAPISSMRIGTHLPKHTLFFDGPYELITLSHETKERLNYAKGALDSALWIHNRKGFYKLEDIFHEFT